MINLKLHFKYVSLVGSKSFTLRYRGNFPDSTSGPGSSVTSSCTKGYSLSVRLVICRPMDDTKVFKTVQENASVEMFLLQPDLLTQTQKIVVCPIQMNISEYFIAGTRRQKHPEKFIRVVQTSLVSKSRKVSTNILEKVRWVVWKSLVQQSRKCYMGRLENVIGVDWKSIVW